MRSKTTPTMAIDRHLGKQLKTFRKARGHTQQTLAELVGLSYQQLHKYETGANSIAASRLLEIAGILGVAPEDFFKGVQLQATAQATAQTQVLSFGIGAQQQAQ